MDAAATAATAATVSMVSLASTAQMPMEEMAVEVVQPVADSGPPVCGANAAQMVVPAYRMAGKSVTMKPSPTEAAASLVEAAPLDTVVMMAMQGPVVMAVEAATVPRAMTVNREATSESCWQI